MNHDDRRLSRRQFCGMGMVAPIAHQKNKNKRKHHNDTILYRGCMQLPEEVCTLAVQSDVYKTTCRKLAVRIKVKGVVYIMRVVCGKNYVGEIVRTEKGDIRVHVWEAVTKNSTSIETILGRLTN